LDLVFDKEKVPELKGTSLKDKLRLFKSAGAPNLQKRPMPIKVADIHKALVDAIDLQTNGTWKLVQDEESETEHTNLSEEEGDEEDEEDDWEDMEDYESESESE
jgi:hypothetical protein